MELFKKIRILKKLEYMYELKFQVRLYYVTFRVVVL
jgi:hypothetical protein